MNEDDLQRVLARLRELKQRDLAQPLAQVFAEITQLVQRVNDLVESGALKGMSPAVVYCINEVHNLITQPHGHITIGDAASVKEQLRCADGIAVEPWQYLRIHWFNIADAPTFHRFFYTGPSFFRYKYQSVRSSSSNGADVAACLTEYRRDLGLYLGWCANSPNTNTARPYDLSLLCEDDCRFRYTGTEPRLTGSEQLHADDVVAYLVCCLPDPDPGVMMELFVRILESQCTKINTGLCNHADLISRNTVLAVCSDYWRRGVRLATPFPFE